MLRKLLIMASTKSKIVALISLAFSVFAFAGVAIWGMKMVQSKDAFFYCLDNNANLFLAVALFVAAIVMLVGISSDLKVLLYDEECIQSGIHLDGTPFAYDRILDRKCSEIYIVGQNLKTLIGRAQFRDKIATLLKKNKMLTVHFIVTTPAVMKTLDEYMPGVHGHYSETIADLSVLHWHSLSEDARKRMHVHAHPGATSLSAIIRDPGIKSRGLMTLSVKWTTDLEPHNRVFLVLEEWRSRALFSRFYGHVGVMTQKENGSLQTLCTQLGLPWPPAKPC